PRPYAADRTFGPSTFTLTTNVARCPMSEANPDDSREWELLVRRFERAWHQGERPVIHDYLPAGAPARAAALIELVHIDLEFRLKAGDAARVEEYLQRYPELRSDRTVVLELIESEYRLRRRREPTLMPDEFFARFLNYQEELEERLSPTAPLPHH